MIHFDDPFLEHSKSLKLNLMFTLLQFTKQQAIYLLHRKPALFLPPYMLMDYLLSTIPVMQGPEIVNISLNHLQRDYTALAMQLGLGLVSGTKLWQPNSQFNIQNIRNMSKFQVKKLRKEYFLENFE